MARSAIILLGALGLSFTAPAVAQMPSRDTSVSASFQGMMRSHWSTGAARDLVSLIQDAGDEGLRPQDYQLAALRQALAAGGGASLDAAAQTSAMALAHDYLLGRVQDRAAFDWHIQPDDAAEALLPSRIDAAVAAGEVKPFFRSLLPTDSRYVALREALPNTTDPIERDRIRANMERWRWMPRALGPSYLYVNVPSYRLQVIDNEAVRSTWTVVVGAPDTPTPVLATDTSSLVVNPWWNVPQSIVKKSALRPGRAGYVFKASAGGWIVRQPPGPRNSLGRIKFNLVNDQAIYLHDTPAKALFARNQRALSHGCIRVKNIDQLASDLVASEGVADTRFEEALADSKTQTIPLARTWPVYLVYFTVDQDETGQLVNYGDPYDRDAALVAQLDGGRRSASITMASN